MVEYISIREAAERVGVGHKVIRRLVSQGVIAASRFHGAHGVEWRIDASSLDAYAAHRAAPRPAAGPPAPAAPASAKEMTAAAPEALSRGVQAELEALRVDKQFLTRQLDAMTSLLSSALSGAVAPPAAPTPHTDGAAAAAPPPANVTAALQSSLQSLGPEAVRSFELCSIKVLWGKPVLWRVAVEELDDVARLVSAVLSPTAQWVPPGEEVVFVWAFDAMGSVLWGAACGPGWFGADFEAELSACRVTRR
ncbi:MAG TPA: helix-turn-helix domain-containing protein [Armatimonadota bacterium]|jgi:excisionase family DNA binding protein